MSDKYQILRSLRRGGVAEVFEAQAERLDGSKRRVALKRLLPIYKMDPDVRAAFVDEARIAAQLRHPNIVAVLDYGTTDGSPFQALEMIDGLDLHQISEREDIPQPFALTVVMDVLRALEYAHAAKDSSGRPMNIVHRDVTPSNVLISWEGTVKLGDFGIASAANRFTQTQDGFTKGTLAYMAPEQSRGDPVDRRTDIYTVGCLLHWLYAGESPLESNENRQAHYAGKPLELDRSLDGGVGEIVGKALSFDADGRYATAREMADAIWPILVSLTTDEPSEIAQRFMATVRTLSGDEKPAKKAVGDLFDPGLLATDEEGPLQYEDATKRMPDNLDSGELTDRSTKPLTDPTSPVQVDVAMTEVPRPQTINGFTVQETVQRTEDGVLCRAKHQTLAIERCVKIFSLANAPDEVRSVLAADARALSLVKHPNVVRFEDFGELPDRSVFTMMPWLPGRTLAAVVRQDERLGPDRTRNILLQLASGLEALHAAGITHGALTSRDVIVDGNKEHATIVGFGTSRFVRTTSALLRSPNYQAPETIERPGKRIPAADIYALGCITFEMLDGSTPFSGTPPDILSQHADEEPPGMVVETIGPLIRDMLAKDPAARPSASQILARLAPPKKETPPERAVAPVVDPAEAPPPPTPQPVVPSAEPTIPDPPKPKPQWPLAVALIALMVITAVITAWIFDVTT